MPTMVSDHADIGMARKSIGARRQPVSAHTYADASSANATSSIIFGMVMLALAVALPWYFELPLLFDVTSPDFNPLIFMPVVLAGVGIVALSGGVGDMLRARKFGVSTLTVDSIDTGSTFRAVVRTERDIAPTGDYCVTLKCIRRSARRSDDIDGKGSYSDKVLSRDRRTVSANAVRSSQGIPIELKIGAGMPSQSPAQRPADASLRWVVTISAPMPGLNYRARFTLYARGA